MACPSGALVISVEVELRNRRIILFFLTIGVYGLALSVMLALCLANGRDPISTLIIRAKDPTGYAVLAQNLLTYKAFTGVAPPPFIPDVTRAPGYPFFLASILLVARTPLAVSLVQIVLVALTSVLIFRLGKRLFSHGVGLITALLYILDPAAMLFSRSLECGMLVMQTESTSRDLIRASLKYEASPCPGNAACMPEIGNDLLGWIPFPSCARLARRGAVHTSSYS